MKRNAIHRTLQPAWRRWLSAAFLLTFVASTAFAGSSFFWCLSLAQARTACCCPAPAQDPAAQPPTEEGPSLGRSPCCEVRQHDALSAVEQPRHALLDVAAPAVSELPEVVVDFAVAARAAPLHPVAPPLPASRAPPPTPLYERSSRILC